MSEAPDSRAEADRDTGSTESSRASRATLEVPAKFIRLLTGSQQKLHAFILSLVGNRADADDVLQEANMVMWQKHNEFDLDTNFDAWAFTVARYQVMAHRKKKQRSRLHFDDDLVQLLAKDGDEFFTDDHDPRKAALSKCLRKLKPEQRALVAERYEPGGCVNDIAAREGRSPKAVSESLRRIRRSLLKCIERTISSDPLPS